MTTDAVGGVWTYAADLARKLCERGHEVTLVTMGPAPRREQAAQVAGVPGLSLEITDLALEWADPEGRDVPRARDTLLRIVERARPDVVHLNSFREACFDLGVPALVVAHSCVASWWQACRPDQPMEARWHTYMGNVADGLNAADCWATPTAAYRDWIEDFYRPRTRGEALWNGADPSVRIGRKEKTILAAGRLWDEAKNLSALAAVAAEVDWPIAVAGPLQSADSAQGAVAENLHALGELPHDTLLMQMQRAGIFVAPALYEPFGLSILEAAGCGCALVLSDIATLLELWHGAALFVDPRDIDGLRTTLNKLCRHDEMRQRLGEAAREKARRYSLEAMLRNYSRIYSTLTAAPTERHRPAPALELRP
jgi:glycosyltransferase involved in cell wall biosynthesis